MNSLYESDIEQLAIEQLHSLGWEYLHGLAIATGAETAERERKYTNRKN